MKLPALLSIALAAIVDFFRPDFLPHARCTGAVTLVNLTGWAWGVGADETGINIENFQPTVKPEFKEYAMNRQGEKIGFCVGEPATEITIDGEVTGSTGLMAATFAAAVTLANTFALFGSAGGIYLDEASVPTTRSGWKKVSFKFSRNKGIA